MGVGSVSGESGLGSVGGWGSGGSSIGGLGTGVTRSISSAKWGNQVGIPLTRATTVPRRGAVHRASDLAYLCSHHPTPAERVSRSAQRGRGAAPHSKPTAARHSGVGAMILRLPVSQSANTNFPSQQISPASSMSS